MTGRLLVMDADSLVASDIVELLAERAGTRDEVANIAEATARGELDPTESLQRRAATLRGLPESVFDEVLDVLRLTPGTQNLVETLHGRGWAIGLVSESFQEVVAPLAARLGITRFKANALEAIDGILTGRTQGPTIDRAAKARALAEWAEELGVPREDTVAVVGGANDLDPLGDAGLVIAFNARPAVEERSDVAVTSTRLDAVLDHLP